MHRVTDKNNLCHYTTTQTERLETTIEAGQHEIEALVKDILTSQKALVKDMKTGYEKTEKSLQKLKIIWITIFVLVVLKFLW